MTGQEKNRRRINCVSHIMYIKMSIRMLLIVDRAKIHKHDMRSAFVPFDIPKSPILMMFWVVRKMFCAFSGAIDPDHVFL